MAESGGITRGAADPFGVLLIALASLSYAVATAIAKRSTVGPDPIGLATTQLSLAGLMLLPVALTGPRPTDVSAPSLLAVTALGVLGSGLVYLLFYSLLSRVSSTQVSPVAYLLPVWGLFWGAVAGEPVPWVSLLGVAVVLTGLALLNRPAKPGSDRPTRAGA